ncbi:hypothetical protein BN14_04716 [Rhizoctonia solani AG-1 IB]|uniref:Uncharacterized protein n=1 Tax=Thanatephorus cucumeris (strain AG1-IB / isolate 7/3/14) TaxID=1108050 RepID=M5BTY7_THACB|nr:hypothetical protein BN14_04716 [Rhizoctonia solani AG-1 IB]
MSSYLRSWLAPVIGTNTANGPASSNTDAPGPTINLSEPSPPASESGDIEDDDSPPPFPLPNSLSAEITFTRFKEYAAAPSTGRSPSKRIQQWAIGFKRLYPTKKHYLYALCW